jgi:hypothetical protein
LVGMILSTTITWFHLLQGLANTIYQIMLSISFLSTENY